MGACLCVVEEVVVVVVAGVCERELALGVVWAVAGGDVVVAVVVVGVLVVHFVLGLFWARKLYAC